jgi:hypothetical protein
MVGYLDAAPLRKLHFEHAATMLSDYDPVFWRSQMGYVTSLRI